MNRITSTITYGNNAQDLDDWQRSAHPWTIELRYQRRRMTVDFWTGQALGEPTTSDVLSCLASDAAGYENTRSFNEWASDYGYDTDSRKTEQVFNQVRKQSEKLKKLLGDDYSSIVYANEDQIEHFCKD